MEPSRPYIRRPRYADVAATLALVLALSGTAYAVTSLPKNSVGTRQLKNAAVTNAKLHANAVSESKLKPGAVSSTKIQSGAVTNDKLEHDAVNSAKVAANSLTLADLLGADISGQVSFSLGANACGNLNLGVSGAQVGQAVLISFIGNTTPPSSVLWAPAKVTAANIVTVRACNVSGSAFSVSSLGVRIITFG